MIIVREHIHIGPHVVHNHRKPLKQGIDGLTAAEDPYPMEKNPDEIPMFTRFAERGLSLPASDFFKGLLGYYDIEYLNLNPNGIFHTSFFVHLRLQ
jgi:hypothetical protein